MVELTHAEWLRNFEQGLAAGLVPRFEDRVRLRSIADDLERLEAALRNIVECDDMAAELYTNDKDRADSFAGKARAVLRGVGVEAKVPEVVR